MTTLSPAVLPLDGMVLTPAADPGRSLHGLFEARAARTPAAPAVVLPHGVVDYATLDWRANQMAHHLVRRGVGPDHRVGVMLRCGADALASVLGVLKAGAAFVAVDPSDPADRVARVLDVSSAGVVIARAGEPAADALAGRDVLRIQGEACGIAAEPGAPVERVARRDAAACVSCSRDGAGRPRTAVVSHRAAVAHVRASVDAYGLRPADRVFGAAAHSSTAFLEQLMAPVSVGAAVVFRGAGEWSPAAFADDAACLGMTVVHLAAEQWRALAADGPALARVRASVRLAVTDSDELRADVARTWNVLPGTAQLR